MKSHLLIVFVIMSWSALAQNPLEQIAVHEMKGNAVAAGEMSSSAVSNTNIIYDRLDLYIDPAVTYIKGEVSTTFIPDNSINFVAFDFTDSLHADSVIYHGTQISFIHSGNILRINLPQAIPGSIPDSISIYYQGVPDSTGFGSFVRSTHDSVPIIWTLSEPYGARDWWPCKQDLQDKIDSIDLFITTPTAYKAASNGLLTEQFSHGPNTTYHWKHRYPIATYLVCVAVTNYRVFTNLVPYKGDTLSILNYVYPEDYAVDTIASLGTIADMQLYDSLFGVYPFSKEKYGQVEFGWPGGMEHQTMTFMNNYDFEVVAHELAHHWFGDKVTCNSWHDIWLNEGFAVYLTSLCYSQFANLYWYHLFLSDAITNATSVPDGSVWCDDTTSVARIFNKDLSYSKGAMVLHQLGWILGDSIFFAGLRSYLSDTTNAYAFGTTLSLQKHLEQIGGMDLTDYFNQYVYGKGFPSYQLQWSQDFSGQVTLTIGQTQSDPSVQFFKIPVPIKFKNSSIDTLMVFNPSASGQTYSFELPFLADSLIFDPELQILSANNTVTAVSVSDFSCLVYPNPAHGILQLQLESSQSGNAEIQIYNLEGQIVWHGNSALQPGPTITNIDISQLPAGVYELKALRGKQSAAASFIVSNVAGDK